MSKAVVGAVEIGAAVGLAAVTGGVGGILALATLQGGGLLSSAALGLAMSGVSMEAGAIADALTQNRGMGITTRQPASFRQIIYGTQRVGGVIVYRSTTGSHFDQYNYVIVLATHEINAIQNLYLDGRRVYWQEGSGGNVTRGGYNFGGSADGNDYIGPDGQHYNFGTLVYCEARFGDQLSGDVISGLTANDPNWTSSANGSPYLGGCAYVYLKVEYDAAMFPQEPEIRFTIDGKNDVYDPRTSARGFTSNWALVVGDVLTDPTWGLGDQVNEQQLIAAANVCDEQIPLAAGLTASAAGEITSIPIEFAGIAVGSVQPSMQITISGDGTGASATPVITQVPNTVPPQYQLSGINVSGGSGYTHATATIQTENWTAPPEIGVPVISAGETSTLSEAQFTCHFHYDTSTSVGDVLQTMMESKCGRLSYVGGEWLIFPPYWQGPSFSLDENALVAEPTWIPNRSVTELVNRVTGTFIAPNYPYNVAGNLYDSNGWYNGTIQDNFPYAFQPTSFPMYACDQLHGYGEGIDVYLTADNGIRHPRELTQACTLSVSEAQRIAKIYLMRNRQQGSGTFPMSLAAWQMQSCDVMQFSMSSQNWVNKYLEISGTRFRCERADDSNGNSVQRLYVECSVQETDRSVYEWSMAEELTMYDVPAAPDAVPYIVPQPTNLTVEDDTSTQTILLDGTTMPRMLVSWTPPSDTYVNNGGKIEVQYQFFTNPAAPQPLAAFGATQMENEQGQPYWMGPWIDAGSVSGDATYMYIEGVNQTQFQNINVQIRAVRSSGAASEWVLVTNRTLLFTQPILPIGAAGGGSGSGPILRFQGGRTLDTLEPAEAGADVTRNHVLTSQVSETGDITLEAGSVPIPGMAWTLTISSLTDQIAIQLSLWFYSLASETSGVVIDVSPAVDGVQYETSAGNTATISVVPASVANYQAGYGTIYLTGITPGQHTLQLYAECNSTGQCTLKGGGYQGESTATCQLVF